MVFDKNVHEDAVPQAISMCWTKLFTLFAMDLQAPRTLLLLDATVSIGIDDDSTKCGSGRGQKKVSRMKSGEAITSKGEKVNGIHHDKRTAK
jgi:hypothetical protein